MKYGILFLVLAFAIGFSASTSGGMGFLLLWPAVSFGMVGLAYLGLGSRVYGKRPDGSMSRICVSILLPYLLLQWGVWHVIRLVSREPAYDTLIDGVLIGRRLVSSELPDDVSTVVDLTSEFVEPASLRSVANYIAVPMLDAAVLPTPSLATIASQIAAAETPIYIHCAQGHGRTGLIAALLLIARGDTENADAALSLVQAARPGVRLNSVQKAALLETVALMEAGRV